MTHAAIPTEWWFSYNEDERLLTNWTRRYKVYWFGSASVYSVLYSVLTEGGQVWWCAVWLSKSDDVRRHHHHRM